MESSGTLPLKRNALSYSEMWKIKFVELKLKIP